MKRIGEGSQTQSESAVMCRVNTTLTITCARSNFFSLIAPEVDEVIRKQAGHLRDKLLQCSEGLPLCMCGCVGMSADRWASEPMQHLPSNASLHTQTEHMHPHPPPPPHHPHPCLDTHTHQNQCCRIGSGWCTLCEILASLFKWLG